MDRFDEGMCLQILRLGLKERPLSIRKCRMNSLFKSIILNIFAVIFNKLAMFIAPVAHHASST